MQLEMFEEKSIGKKQPFFLIGKEAIHHDSNGFFLEGLSSALCRRGDFTTPLKDLQEAILDPDDLMKNGYTIVYCKTSNQWKPLPKRSYYAKNELPISYGI